MIQKPSRLWEKEAWWAKWNSWSRRNVLPPAVVENAPFYRPSREIAFPELSWNLKGALEALEGAKRFAE